MTFGAAWTLKTELPPTRELNFHKIAEFRKIRKSTKKWSEKRPPGRDKNRLCDPICLRVGGLAAPAGTNMCPCGSTMQKRSKAGLPETNKLVQDTKKHRKTHRKVPRRNSTLKKNAQIVREVAKTQESIIAERRAPRKHKTNLRKTTNGATNDFLHRNMETYRVQEDVHAHCLQTRGLPLSLIECIQICRMYSHNSSTECALIACLER